MKRILILIWFVAFFGSACTMDVSPPPVHLDNPAQKDRDCDVYTSEKLKGWFSELSESEQASLKDQCRGAGCYSAIAKVFTQYHLDITDESMALAADILRGD